MKTNQRTCAAKGFGVSRTSGCGIPAGMVQYTTTRQIQRKNGQTVYMKVDRYGEFMTPQEAERHNRERGYSIPWGRNTGNFHGFIQSRAARKRGYTPTGAAGQWYQRQQELHAKISRELSAK